MFELTKYLIKYFIQNVNLLTIQERNMNLLKNDL